MDIFQNMVFLSSKTQALLFPLLKLWNKIMLKCFVMQEAKAAVLW